MDRCVDLYDSTYGNAEAEVLARVRRTAFGQDIGQNSWTTSEEYRRWAGWLGLGDRSHVLEVACGSGGPAVFLAGLCGGRVTGVDINPHGVAAAIRASREQGLGGRVEFRVADADQPLPFPDASFDAVLCVDAANHFARRDRVLRDWHRVLRPGGRVLFTDPVVVTGLVSGADLAVRSSIGWFVFAPPGVNDGLIEAAGFDLLRREDVTENAAAIAKRWHDARAEDRQALVRMEGEEQFEGLQQFFDAVRRLAGDRCLCRFAYLARKRNAAEPPYVLDHLNKNSDS
jgi:SAM-dependent methyltransferase